MTLPGFLSVTQPGFLCCFCLSLCSKALMDLLVDLCSRYHLNPAYHTLELLSSEGLSLAFKPNSLLGSLDVVAISIREKVLQDKVVRKPPPKVPEVSTY